MDQKKILDTLNEIGILGDIRQRLGAKDENDTSKDRIILDMDAREMVARQTGWELGEEFWAYNIIDTYLELKERGL
jgi:hypothetical protein